MDHHIRTQRNRLLKIGGHESIVDNQFDLFRAADTPNGGKVAQGHQRIGWSLHIDHARALAQGAFDVLRIGGINVGEFDTIPGEDLIEESRNPTVEIVPADDVISSLVHSAQSIDRCHTAAENPRSDAPFERGKICFQAIARWIRAARVVVSYVFSQFLLRISGGRVDWDRDGAG